MPGTRRTPSSSRTHHHRRKTHKTKRTKHSSKHSHHHHHEKSKKRSHPRDKYAPVEKHYLSLNMPRQPSRLAGNSNIALYDQMRRRFVDEIKSATFEVAKNRVERGWPVIAENEK